MLARLKKTIEETGRSIIVIDDVRKAFDNIQVARLIEAHRQAFDELKNTVRISDAVLRLIAVMARDTDQLRMTGIDQGNNYSPIALNVLLHYIHDLLIYAADHFPFWFRYADNLTYLCQNVSEGQQVRKQVEHLLHSAGLELKGKDGGIFDLREHPATLLGFKLRIRDGETVFSLTDRAWDNLRHMLAESHETLDPDRIALDVITGWVNAYGMAFEKDGKTVDKALHVAAQYGYREIDRERLLRVEGKARKYWARLLA